MAYNSLWFDLMQLRLRSAPTAARSAVVFEGALLRCVPGSRSLDSLRPRARRSATVGCHRWNVYRAGGAVRSCLRVSLRLRLAAPHLTDLPELIGGCLTVPAHRSAPLRSVAGTCTSSLLAPCSASRSSLVQTLSFPTARSTELPPKGVPSFYTARLWAGGARTLKRVRREWGACPPHGATKCGRWLSGQRPERTPRQGAKVTRRISGESEPLCVAGASH